MVTDKGRDATRQRREALRRVESHVLAELTPTETATFRTLLQRVACAAQTLDPLTDLCEVAGRPPGRTPTPGTTDGALWS